MTASQQNVVAVAIAALAVAPIVVGVVLEATGFGREDESTSQIASPQFLETPRADTKTRSGDVGKLQRLAAQASVELAAMAQCRVLSCHLARTREACGTLSLMEGEADSLEEVIGREAVLEVSGASDSCDTAVGLLQAGDALEAAKHVREVGGHLRRATSAIARRT